MLPDTDNPFMAHPPGKKLWKITLDFKGLLTSSQIEQCSDALEPFALSVLARNQEATDGDNWMIELVCQTPPDPAALLAALAPAAPDITQEELEDRDWLTHVHDAFPPFAVGRFFIHGSHYAGPVPQDKTPLLIDAATAFGSGEHGTTAGCLEALETLAASHTFARGLDMGCGSGILAAGMAKLWPALPVLAVDIDPESVRVTLHHAELNGVSDRIEALAGDGYQALPDADEQGYDLIVANILANPLVEMAPDLFRFLKRGGYAVLSGLLVRQKDLVLQAHTQLGLTLESAVAIGDWQTLVLKK